MKSPEINDSDGIENRKKKLASLFESGLDSEDCIGYHGTSLEALEYMIEHGYLPGNSDQDKINAIHFYPLRSAFKDVHSNTPLEENVVKEAAGYASDISGEHYFLKKLNIPFDNEETRLKSRYLVIGCPNDPSDPNAEYNYFLKMGVDKRALDEALFEARKRKGVVLSFNNEIVKSFKIMPGDPGDLKIITPNGLSLDYISGIEPMGQKEWDYLEKLQK